MNAARRPWVLLLAAGPWLGALRPARAHGSWAGEVLVDHPYAPPTAPGAREAAVHFRGLANRGRQAERLIGARCEVAERVLMLRRGGAGAEPQAVPALDLPAGAELRARHGGDCWLALQGLRGPLRDGERFALWLRFERAGELEVSVWVQQPRTRS